MSIWSNIQHKHWDKVSLKNIQFWLPNQKEIGSKHIRRFELTNCFQNINRLTFFQFVFNRIDELILYQSFNMLPRILNVIPYVKISYLLNFDIDNMELETENRLEVYVNSEHYIDNYIFYKKRLLKRRYVRRETPFKRKKSRSPELLPKHCHKKMVLIDI